MSGSRRFFPVVALACDHTYGGIDLQQVWAEVKTWWVAGEQWWLTDEEDAMRMAQAEDFRGIDPAEETMQEFLDSRTGTPSLVNATEFCEMCQIYPINKNTRNIAARVLRNSGLPYHKDTTVDGKRVKKKWEVPTAQNWVVLSEFLEAQSVAVGETCAGPFAAHEVGKHLPQDD